MRDQASRRSEEEEQRRRRATATQDMEEVFARAAGLCRALTEQEREEVRVGAFAFCPR